MMRSEKHILIYIYIQITYLKRLCLNSNRFARDKGERSLQFGVQDSTFCLSSNMRLRTVESSKRRERNALFITQLRRNVIHINLHIYIDEHIECAYILRFSAQRD